ncbi:11784_t:CDS:2, partial [Acaulospora morrowiae]
ENAFMMDNGGFGESSRWTNTHNLPFHHDPQHPDNYGPQHGQQQPKLQQPQLPEFQSSEPLIKVENSEEHHITDCSPKKSPSLSTNNDCGQNNQSHDCQLFPISKKEEEIVEATMERERVTTLNIKAEKTCTDSAFKKYKELLLGGLDRPVFIREADAPNLSELQRVVLELLFI